jgi:hypothetical protein
MFKPHESLDPRGERVGGPCGGEGDYISKAGEGHRKQILARQHCHKVITTKRMT